ncbi:polysialyltransferase family glycosyltransferase [Winogradskyella poriferorum]|uniref:polysialyltransferase family glycosyltransferase n=1 Tax=Winogradskyella poriferorum TaxID=307627 RepID=UPI003D64D993
MKPRFCKYLIMISSTFQFLNVTEYLGKYGIERRNCILVLMSKRKKVNHQILELFNDEKFAEVIFLFDQKRIGIFRAEFLAKKKLKRLSFENIIIGNLYNIWCEYLINLHELNHKPVVVDDGTLTIVISYNRKKKITPKSRLLNRDFIFSQFFLRTKKKYKGPYKFFTIFDNLEFSINDTIENNDLKQSKSTYSVPKNDSPEIWILGTPIVQKKMISELDYLSMIKRIEKFANSNQLGIKYFKHRIENHYEFPICQFENSKPFEIFYLESTITPKYIVSFYSTTLFTMNKLGYSGKLMFINISDDKKKQGDWFNIELVYDVLNRSKEIKDFDEDFI